MGFQSEWESIDEGKIDFLVEYRATSGLTIQFMVDVGKERSMPGLALDVFVLDGLLCLSSLVSLYQET